MPDNSVNKIIVGRAVPLSGPADVADEILDLCGDARFVLIGEASHGTHEFYRCRAEITKRLIAEKGFTAVAVEADFPDAYRVNRYVRGVGNDGNARASLSDFQRYPLWMWRNADVLDFVTWLRSHNDGLDASRRIGFYGIDLYSLHSSMEAVLKFLDKADPEAAKRARYRYSCFEGYGEDAQVYGYAANFDLTKSCEDKAVEQLQDLRKKSFEYMNRDGFVAKDEYFYAEQNARVVRDAEEYYREMFRGRVSSWNLRDGHMTETLVALDAHLESQELPSKIVVWAHNSHLGDARATDMGKQGEWNVGQLVREKFRGQTINLGFTTFAGTVTATSNWDEQAQKKTVREGMKNSVEKLFHDTGIGNFFVNLRDEEVRKALPSGLLERAIGVIYRPESERVSHYFTRILLRSSTV